MLLIQEQIYHATGGTATSCNGGVPLTARNETTLGLGINLAFDDCTAAANAACGEGTTGQTNEQIDAIRRAAGTLVRDYGARGFYSAGNLYDKGAAPR